MLLSRLRVPPGRAALACAALAGLAAWWWPPSLFALPVASLLTGRLSPDPRPAAVLYGVGTAAWALRFALAGEPVGMWVVGGGLALLTLLLPWLVGLYLRSAAALERAGWERARRLEREARLVAERARMRERSRIAQDLHDAVGHELSLLALRAGGLEMASDLSEERRGQAAELREAAGRAADRLVEAVGVLRDDAAPEAPPLGPIGDGDAALGDLAERARASGMDVELTDDGALHDVPVLVERAAFRVVQEALTNAAKHAPGAAVRILVEGAPGEVSVQVRDSGPAADASAPEAPGGGTGLVGLRERVRLAGGSLDAGPGRDERGWTVAARLPLQAREAASPSEARLGRPEDSGSGVEAADAHLRRARRRAGWAVAAAVGLPAAMVAAGYAASIAFTVYQAETASLAPSVFAALEPGQTRAEVEGSLPRRDLYEGPLASGGRPASPDGLECRYYRSDGDVFGGGGERYRLCFDEEKLVSAETVGR
ncbi:histidine kinase [Nocardiopsis sp. RSe5-2]|uniref:histidine kinase n=1 Tax=Nocardiopsis endophytica TaxID=3018445 RepID=A0ABT4TZJ7_9ACTN|nr:histidine kinase [Nocardiopsis endophytica]MDA2810115.1 histidine kinase [Nocardiopsis endophytica]